MPLVLLLTKERFLYANLYGMFPKLSSKALIGVFNYGFIRRIGITESIKLPTFIYLLFWLFTTQPFIRRKDYISEFPYILTTLYEFYMNVDMQVICCTVTSALSLIFSTCTCTRQGVVQLD